MQKLTFGRKINFQKEIFVQSDTFGRKVNYE